MNPACQRVREHHLELRCLGSTPEIDAHLRHCVDCADHCARHERVARLLTSLPRHEAPPSLWSRVEEGLELTGADREEDSATVGELFSQLPYRSAPPDLWNRVRAEIDRRESVLWAQRPGSRRVRRWTRLARAAAILLPLLIGSYLLWSDGQPRGRKAEIIWTTERVERSADPSDPIEQVAFQLGDGSWAPRKR